MGAGMGTGLGEEGGLGRRRRIRSESSFKKSRNRESENWEVRCAEWLSWVRERTGLERMGWRQI